MGEIKKFCELQVGDYFELDTHVCSVNPNNKVGKVIQNPCLMTDIDPNCPNPDMWVVWTDNFGRYYGKADTLISIVPSKKTMTDAIAIRKKVAELCGFSDLSWYHEPFVPQLKGFKFGLQIPIPKYETSLDAIEKAFDEHGLTYTLSKRVSEDTNEDYFATSGLHNAFSDTAAKAMCYLFIHCMEKK